MERPAFQLSMAALLLLVACIALNIWLFRLGVLLGIVGLNVTKHVMIAYVCQVLGVDRRRSPRAREATPAPARPTSLPVPELPPS